jgi:hypothetical protein
LQGRPVSTEYITISEVEELKKNLLHKLKSTLAWTSLPPTIEGDGILFQFPKRNKKIKFANSNSETPHSKLFRSFLFSKTKQSQFEVKNLVKQNKPLPEFHFHVLSKNDPVGYTCRRADEDRKSHATTLFRASFLRIWPRG